MGSTSSTAHRLEIRRALYLITSDKKLFLEISDNLRPKLQVKRSFRTHVPLITLNKKKRPDQEVESLKVEVAGVER